MRDISQLKDALGTIIATYTYMTEPISVLKETDLMIRYELAMLDALDKLDTPVTNDMTYRELFRLFRQEWYKAMNIYSANTSWKDAFMLCSGLLDNLMRIAVKEGLVDLSTSYYLMAYPNRGPISKLLTDIKMWFIKMKFRGL